MAAGVAVADTVGVCSGEGVAETANVGDLVGELVGDTVGEGVVWTLGVGRGVSEATEPLVVGVGVAEVMVAVESAVAGAVVGDPAMSVPR